MKKGDFIDWYLISLYLKKETTPEQAGLVEQWLKADPAHQAYLDAASKAWQEDIASVYTDPETGFQKLIARIKPGRRRAALQRRLLKYVAAACVLTGLWFCCWLYFRPSAPLLPYEPAKMAEHIHPGSSKATLVLENGLSVPLGDSLIKMNIHGVNIQNDTTCNLLYIADTAGAISQNRLIVPRGGEYCVTLSDGTIVWLNSASELTYPTVFRDKERQVELKGEAYFKVSHDAGRPFIVTSGNYRVEVLGTEFNLCAYPDETRKTTTLVKGKVKVNISEFPACDTLFPNMQLTYDAQQCHKNIKQVNTDIYCNWRKGHFEFEHTPLEQFMKIVSRWYDFDYQITDKTLFQYHFTGAFQKSDNIDDLFRILRSSRIPVEITYRNHQVILSKR